MKTNFLSFFLLFSLSTQPLLQTPHASSPEQVFDISGGKLLIGFAYYVLPVPTSGCEPSGTCRSVGGLALASAREQQPCPLDVVAMETYQGLPVVFNAMSRRQSVVNVSDNVNIQFYAETSCPLSTVWKLDEFDASTQQWFVTTGGALGSPGKKTVRNWFMVEKYDSDYKIRYCPTVCKHCKVQCSDVGVFVDENENKRLVLSNVPLKVRFQQASRA
ncbi:Miraculin protein [Spatholobus suberectus]|nr:Miraculin protein [Spatholobus suberectus]